MKTVILGNLINLGMIVLACASAAIAVKAGWVSGPVNALIAMLFFYGIYFVIVAIALHIFEARQE